MSLTRVIDPRRPYIEALDRNLVAQLGGQMALAGFDRLGVSTVINPQRFVEAEGFEPDIATIWMLGGVNAGGSGGTAFPGVYLVNGTLTEPEALSDRYAAAKWGFTGFPRSARRVMAPQNLRQIQRPAPADLTLALLRAPSGAGTPIFPGFSTTGGAPSPGGLPRTPTAFNVYMRSEVARLKALGMTHSAAFHAANNAYTGPR